MVSSQLLKEFGFEPEERETTQGGYGKTGFPCPLKSYWLTWQQYDMSLEEPYYWILDVLKEFNQNIDKVEDSFAAAENSAFFGVSQQRLGAQQDRVSTFLATTGKMIKELFQMVRELRILDERLTYYRGVNEQLEKDVSKRSVTDEITLKGMFVDLVQGGGKSAASVYGMAQQLEFITLPDLFFDAPPFKNVEEIDAHIKVLEKDFNRNVLRVLQRHLRQYVEWRKRTHQEHENRQRFMLTYLKQHFEIIQMYINWIKPYLRHVTGLTLKEKGMQSADIISAFESSMLDVEIIAYNRIPVGKSGANGCVLVTFNYRTRAEMKVQQEGYQRGPVHFGRMDMNIRMYTWTDEQLNNYKKMKQKESLDLIGDVSSSVREAMEALGKELDYYLEEANKLAGRKTKEEESSEKEKKEKKPNKSFISSLLGEFYTPKSKKEAGPSRKELIEHDQKMKVALEKISTPARLSAWNTYNNFKKAHRMIAW